jgi:hypothetical protein
MTLICLWNYLQRRVSLSLPFWAPYTCCDQQRHTANIRWLLPTGIKYTKWIIVRKRKWASKVCVCITELKKPTHIGRSHGFGVPDLWEVGCFMAPYWSCSCNLRKGPHNTKFNASIERWKQGTDTRTYDKYENNHLRYRIFREWWVHIQEIKITQDRNWKNKNLYLNSVDGHRRKTKIIMVSVIYFRLRILWV